MILIENLSLILPDLVSDNVSNEVKDIHTTTDKISKKFESISSVDIDALEYHDDLNN